MTELVIVTIIGIIILLAVLVISSFAIKKGYAFKQTIDPINNETNENNRKNAEK